MNNFYCFVANQFLIFIDFPLSVFIEHNVCAKSSYHPDIRCIRISSTISRGLTPTRIKQMRVYRFSCSSNTNRLCLSIRPVCAISPVRKKRLPRSRFQAAEQSSDFLKLFRFLPFRILSFFYSTASSTASFSEAASFIISLYFLMMSTMI